MSTTDTNGEAGSESCTADDGEVRALRNIAKGRWMRLNGPELERDGCIELHESYGWEFRQIGKATGIPYSTVFSWVDKARRERGDVGV